MASGKDQFSKEVALVLRNADRHMRAMASQSHYNVYHFWRITMTKLCRVDAFYIGFYRDNRTITFPYNFDEQNYDAPERLNYGEHGLCAWILRNKKTYFYAQDQGSLLKNGQNFGDVSRLSCDAIVIPMFEPSDSELRVVGMASIQSYKPNTYNQEIAHAFQWLAKSVMTVLLRNREDAINRRDLGFDERIEFHKDPIAAVVEEISFKLERLRKEAQEIHQKVRSGDMVSAEKLLDKFTINCEQIQTDTMEFLTMRINPESNPFNDLTPRQKQVATLIAQGLSNEEIALRLKIKLETVKTHVSDVLGKFGVRQREGVITTLNYFNKI